MDKKRRSKLSFGICTIKDGKIVDIIPISKYEWRYAIREVYKLNLPSERRRRKEMEYTLKISDKSYEVSGNSSHKKR
jgi:hypothetical protein